MTTTVYIIEGHPLMQEMLAELINESEGLRVCGVAESGENALDQMAALAPGIVLIDLSISGMRGIELLRDVRNRWVSTPVVMLSGEEEQSFASRAFAAGANGFVVKGNPDEIVEALRHVARGENYLSAALREPDSEH